VIHNFTNDVHYSYPPPSPGVIPAGVGNLALLNGLYLSNTMVSGTWRVPLLLGYGWFRIMIVVIHSFTNDIIPASQVRFQRNSVHS